MVSKLKSVLKTLVDIDVLESGEVEDLATMIREFSIDVIYRFYHKSGKLETRVGTVRDYSAQLIEKLLCFSRECLGCCCYDREALERC